MQLPEQLLAALDSVKGFNRQAFEAVHQSGEQLTSIRLNPAKQISHPFDGKIDYQQIPWATQGYYLANRPSFTFDPLFHAGIYYVQEASSMFLEQALQQTVNLSASLKILDVCASPGGKSTHLQSLISKESLLVSNEVIRARANVLKDNIIKWGTENVVVTNNDPKAFAKLPYYFDVLVVDAPCSGSGLFRKDADAIGEWSENNVALCSQRQQRILADVWTALKEDGVLIYSTCSYSVEEDEAIMDWITETFDAQNITLTTQEDWNITETVTAKENYGYRFWPDKTKGEGFFLGCFKKKEGESDNKLKVKQKPEEASKKEVAVIENWVKADGFIFMKHLQTVYAWPSVHLQDFSLLLQHLNVIYSGVLTGELIRDKLVPHHSLALSTIIQDAIPVISINEDAAIKYLQRKEFQIETDSKGWHIVAFKGYKLGWVNNLQNRVNNYYPKELRILKEK